MLTNRQYMSCSIRRYSEGIQELLLLKIVTYNNVLYYKMCMHVILLGINSVFHLKTISTFYMCMCVILIRFDCNYHLG